MRVKFVIVLLIALISCVLSSAAFAQTQDPFPPPPAPVWSSAYGSSATADGACHLQHQALNPNAPYLPPSFINETNYGCNWTAKQFGGPPNSNTHLAGTVSATCSPGSLNIRFQNGMCIDIRTETPICDACDAARGVSAAPSPFVGNPVSITTGYKVQDETDYSTADGLFAVKRRYTSSASRPGYPLPLVGFGETWQGLVPGRLYINDYRMQYIYYTAGNGESQHVFQTSNSDLNNWTYSSPNASRVRLTMVSVPSVTRTVYFGQAPVLNGPAEFRLDFANGEYLLFRRSDVGTNNRNAVPIEHGFATGYKLFFDYPDAGLYPNRVRDSFGREMTLTWVNAPMSPIFTGFDDRYRAINSILLPDGTTLNYDYESADWGLVFAYTDTGGNAIPNSVYGRKDRLAAVRRTNAAGGLLWKRSYLYEDGRWPYALTGIKDQNDARLSTYTYDQAGLAASSERAGGVGRYEFRQFWLNNGGSIDWNYVYREVTNPLAHVERYQLWRDYIVKPYTYPRTITKIEGFATANVPADVATWEYQTNTNKSNRLITATVDPRGTRTTYALDFNNSRPTSAVEAQGTAQPRTTTITWHPTFDMPTREDRTGLRIDYTYSSPGQPLTRTETDTTTTSVPYSTAGQTRTWTYGWGTGGRLLSINGPKPIDAQGKDDALTFTYDAAGNLLTSTNGLGDVTSFADYDANGRPGTMTDPNGVVTAFTYDVLGRTTAVTVKHPTTASLDATTTLEYDVENRVVGVTSPATEKLFVDYDLAGRLTALRMASGERIDYQSDAMGDVTAETVKRADASAARSISRTFDELGRMLTETLGPSRTTTWAYDKNGNATQVTSARSNATQAAFDPLNRLVSTVAPGTATTTLAYNAIDAMISHTDPVSVQTTFVRNGFGDAIREVSPDRGTSTFYYNEAGELTASIDGRGQRVDYTRDILGRATSKTPVGRPASEIITYAWDTAGLSGSYGKGRLASVTDGTGTTRFAYDHRGNLITKSQAIGSTSAANLSYSYDLADRIAQIVYPSGRVVEYVRDGKGRVTAVQTKAAADDPTWTVLAGSIAYEPWGSMTGAVLGNGLSMSQSWGNDGRLASKRLYATATGADLSLLTYAYDNDDNITAITDGLDAAKSVQYAYDNRDRLAQSIAASGPVKRLDYLFDKNGNRTSVEQRAEAADVTPIATDIYARTAGTNRLASITSASATRSIAYDARGNTSTESRPGSVAVAATYDGYGRLLSYDRTGDPAQTNAYNGLDDRVSVTSGGTTRNYVYDPDGRLLGEYGTSAADLIAETIWLRPEVANDNQPLGEDDGVDGYAPLAVAAGSGAGASLHWVHGNHLGVPLVATDASGAAITPAGYTMPGFPGQTRTLGDFYYNRYRDYDSSTGRYIQADPIGLEGGSNPYLYAEGNPVRFTDPLGLSAFAIVGGATARDLTTPDRTDLMPLKWAGYGALTLCALAYDQWRVLEKKRQTPRRRRSPSKPCSSCGAPHGGSTGTTECPDCDGKRKAGYPLPGPPPRRLE